MIKVIPSPGRIKLEFAKLVLEAFDFLTKDFGFRCVQTEMTLVKFESPDVFVTVYHGRASYEIGVEIGLMNVSPSQSAPPFTIRDIVEFNGAAKKTGYTREVTFSASTPELVKKFVYALADLVRIYAVPVLNGDNAVIKQLEEFRSKEAEQFENESRMHQIRSKADIAWQRKDYASLVNLYEQVNEFLTPAETKKMEYARKKLIG